jgi:hypothetical protein
MRMRLPIHVLSTVVKSGIVLLPQRAQRFSQKNTEIVYRKQLGFPFCLLVLLCATVVESSASFFYIGGLIADAYSTFFPAAGNR